MPLFSVKSLRSFLPLIDKVSNKFFETFDHNLKNETFDIYTQTMDYSITVNLKTLFGFDSVDEKFQAELSQSFHE